MKVRFLFINDHCLDRKLLIMHIIDIDLDLSKRTTDSSICIQELASVGSVSCLLKCTEAGVIGLNSSVIDFIIVVMYRNVVSV